MSVIANIAAGAHVEANERDLRYQTREAAFVPQQRDILYNYIDRLAALEAGGTTTIVLSFGVNYISIKKEMRDFDWEKSFLFVTQFAPNEKILRRKCHDKKQTRLCNEQSHFDYGFRTRERQSRN